MSTQEKSTSSSMSEESNTSTNNDTLLHFQAVILENVRDSVIVTDLEHRITYWNKGATQLFGYTAAEMMGKTPDVLSLQQNEARETEDFQRILGGQDYIGEWQGRRKDGTLVWIDAKSTVLRNHNEIPIGFMSPAAKASEYVTYEWAFVWGAGIPVIPVLYKDTKLHPRLEALHYLNFTNRSARLDADDATAWRLKGVALIYLERYEEALTYLEQALVLGACDKYVWQNKGTVFSRLEKYEEALTAYEQALHLDANYALAWHYKGVTLQRLGRSKQAQQAFEKARQLGFEG